MEKKQKNVIELNTGLTTEIKSVNTSLQTNIKAANFKKDLNLKNLLGSQIKVAGFENDSITNGPGLRFVIFTQGCPFRCDGCHNPKTWDMDGGKITSTESILKKIKRNPLLDGVTFTGGEPMLWAKELFPLAMELKKLNYNLAIYTGFTFEELTSGKMPYAYELLKFADTLIDGQFKKELRDITLKFKGSKNQRIIDLKQSFKTKAVVLDTTDKWN